MRKLLVGLSLSAVLFGAVSCTPIAQQRADNSSVSPPMTEPITEQVTRQAAAKPGIAVASSADSSTAQAAAEGLETAIFAGGCFWCMEKPFDELPGVVSTTSGYTGGSVENPSYEEVSRGGTGHYEAMSVRYDPQQVSYEKLLETFWVNVDPVDARGQFCDKGDQYRSAIFYDTPEQAALAKDSKAAIATKLKSQQAEPIATEILPAAPFYDAEDYHQNYYQTHPVRYRVYRYGCGRDQRLSEVWGADAPAHE
ncbi:MAG: peptide-methionine (S)-S-oxide reductase MsrA [Phormidesmis sp.]